MISNGSPGSSPHPEEPGRFPPLFPMPVIRYRGAKGNCGATRMKRQWEQDELIESFILLPHELALLPSNMTNANPHN